MACAAGGGTEMQCELLVPRDLLAHPHPFKEMMLREFYTRLGFTGACDDWRGYGHLSVCARARVSVSLSVSLSVCLTLYPSISRAHLVLAHFVMSRWHSMPRFTNSATIRGRVSTSKWWPSTNFSSSAMLLCFGSLCPH